MGYDEYLANLGLKHHCLYKEQFLHELFWKNWVRLIGIKGTPASLKAWLIHETAG